MKQITILCAALAAMLLGNCAPKVAAQASSQSQNTENSLLWEISGKDIKTPSYLYGTIHLIAADDFFITPETQKVLDKVDRYVFEINMDDMMDMGNLMSLMEKAMMNDNTTLKDLLSKSDYALVDSVFTAKGLPLMFLERMKPMFLSIFASTDLSGGGLQADNSKTKSYEMEFNELAKKNKKTIGGLETADYQMSMFDSIPYKAQAEMLVESIKGGSSGAASGEAQMAEMVKLYKNQDLEALGKLMEGDGIGEYSDLLLNNRNRNWIPVMSKMMLEKTNLFAVGAGHLGGKNGVVNLLRQAGYTVKPLK